MSLPADSLGAVLDLDDLKLRLTGLLGVLSAVLIDAPTKYAFALRVEPIAFLTIGNASVIGSRSSASMAFATGNRSSFQADPEDYVDGVGVLEDHAGELAAELISRLRAETKKR